MLPAPSSVVRAFDLEERARVVVEPANELGVDFVGRAERVELTSQLVPVRPIIVAEEVEDRGGARNGLGVGGVLRVEDAERVRRQAPLRVRGELVLERGERGDERFLVFCTRLGAADRVDEDVGRLDADVAEEPDEGVNHLGVAAGAGIPDALGSRAGRTAGSAHAAGVRRGTSGPR